MTSDHLDAVAVFLVGLMLLAFVEVRLRSLFARHETREEKMHAGAVLLAEGAAARVADTMKAVNDLRVETNAIRLDVNNLSELVRVHEARIVEAEMRIMRSSLLVPRRAPEGT